MQEIHIEGGGYYWEKILSALGGDTEGSELLCWGKVGRVLRQLALPGQELQDPDNDAELHVRLLPLHNMHATGWTCISAAPFL
jgi:hypothetical protein